jgi:flavin reductase (DIM6/NTAB) family NADH-FMN oxidoreductase RutF
MSSETSGEGLRERLTRQGEDALGKFAQELLENPLVSGALSRAFEAREKASAAQEAAMGVLNIPSAGDVERLTRRVRSVGQRLEGIEDGVDRLDERLASLRPADAAGEGVARLDDRLAAIEARLEALPSAGGIDERLSAIEARLERLPSAKPLEDRIKRLDQRLRGLAAVNGLADRLKGVERQLTALGAEVARAVEALPAGPDPLPREQERMQVGDGGTG